MTVVDSPADPDHPTDERADLYRRGDRPENLWSTIRHHTSSWSLLWRLLVLVTGSATLAAAIVVLLWLLGVRVGIGAIEVAPVG